MELSHIVQNSSTFGTTSLQHPHYIHNIPKKRKMSVQLLRVYYILWKNKGKGKVLPVKCREDTEVEWKYSLINA
jgi:hypothetical protein